MHRRCITCSRLSITYTLINDIVLVITVLFEYIEQSLTLTFSCPTRKKQCSSERPSRDVMSARICILRLHCTFLIEWQQIFSNFPLFPWPPPLACPPSFSLPPMPSPLKIPPSLLALQIDYRYCRRATNVVGFAALVSPSIRKYCLECQQKNQAVNRAM